MHLMLQARTVRLVGW